MLTVNDDDRSVSCDLSVGAFCVLVVAGGCARGGSLVSGGFVMASAPIGGPRSSIRAGDVAQIVVPLMCC